MAIAPGGRRAAAIAAVLFAAAGCAGQLPPPASISPDGYDVEAAREQARTFATIATGNSWGNYGE